MSKFSTIKITLKDNQILSEFKDLSEYLTSIEWDRPKIFQNVDDCNEYLYTIHDKISSILKPQYKSYESEITNSRFIKFTHIDQGSDIIIIRADYHVELNIPKFIILMVDYGETCDGRPQRMGDRKFFSKQDAIKEIHDDMISMKEKNGYEYLDFDKLEIWENEKSIGQHGTSYSVIQI